MSRRLPPIQGTIGFDIGISYRHSLVLLWGALGAQLIECPTARAFDRQPGELTFCQLAAALAAADFIHCKPFSTIER
jgi:hypothetical protein